MKRLAALLLTISTAACTVGPNYEQPQTTTPPAFEAVPPPGQSPLSQVVDAQTDFTKWWTQFHDPELESLIGRGLQGNLDLKMATSRVRQAREQVVVQRSAGLPTLNATGAAARLHSNSNPLAALTGGMNGNPGASGGSDLELYSAGFDATWEIDVFGGVRRGVEAARANVEASEWQLHDGEVTLTAEVASDYLMLRAAQARMAILETQLQRQRDTLDLIKARAATGFVTELDVNQQMAQVAATQAQLPPLEAQTRARIDALGILLGVQPETLTAELQPAGAIPNVPPTLPVGLPSDLLRRRPDIRNAERKLASATAQVGVAVAGLYPKFNLLGLASFASPSVSSLFSSDQFSAGGLGLIRWPLFTAGRAQANVRTSEEARQQAYLAYQKSVLQALADAEDALARYGAEQRRLVSLEQSVAAANSSLTIANDQYRTGNVPYVNVLTAQTTLLQVQDEATQSRATLSADLVSLYKALGGGWLS